MKFTAALIAVVLVGCSAPAREPVGPTDPVRLPARVQIVPTGHTPGLEDKVAAALRVHADRKHWDGWEFVIRDVAVMTGCRVKYAGPSARKAADAEYVGRHRDYYVGLACPGRDRR